MSAIIAIVSAVLKWEFVPPAETMASFFPVLFWGVSRAVVLAIVFLSWIELGIQSPKIKTFLAKIYKKVEHLFWFLYVFHEPPFVWDSQLKSIQSEAISKRLGQMAKIILQLDADEKETRNAIKKESDGYKIYWKVLWKTIIKCKWLITKFGKGYDSAKYFMFSIKNLRKDQLKEWRDWYLSL